MGWKDKAFSLFADLGDWLASKSRNRDNAILLAILSVISPLGFIFAISFIASVNRKKSR